MDVFCNPGFFNAAMNSRITLRYIQATKLRIVDKYTMNKRLIHFGIISSFALIQQKHPQNMHRCYEPNYISDHPEPVEGPSSLAPRPCF